MLLLVGLCGSKDINMFDDLLHTIGICIILIALVQAFGLTLAAFVYSFIVLIIIIVDTVKIWRDDD